MPICQLKLTVSGLLAVPDSVLKYIRAALSSQMNFQAENMNMLRHGNFVRKIIEWLIFHK